MHVRCDQAGKDCELELCDHYDVHKWTHACERFVEICIRAHRCVEAKTDLRGHLEEVVEV